MTPNGDFEPMNPATRHVQQIPNSFVPAEPATNPGHPQFRRDPRVMYHQTPNAEERARRQREREGAEWGTWNYDYRAAERWRKKDMDTAMMARGYEITLAEARAVAAEAGAGAGGGGGGRAGMGAGVGDLGAGVFGGGLGGGLGGGQGGRARGRARRGADRHGNPARGRGGPNARGENLDMEGADRVW
ncbi:MAG: hypothetical protein MMC33_007308 [Icmadophila ericetorum]|nr:hypothetical protein [Icmadophila ericetorum]